MAKTTRKINWVNTIFLIITPILFITFTYLHLTIEGPSLSVFLWGLFFYLLIGFSITAGYHRLFSHRSYQGHFLVKLAYLIFGAAAFQNSALKWCRDHRYHHQHCDHDKDPYNIKKGFWYAHIGWIFYQEENDDLSNVKDLAKDPLFVWQDKNIFLIGGAFGIILPIIIGFIIGYPLGGIGIMAFGRIVLLHHMTFFINSLCHMVGKVNFGKYHTAKDSFIMSLFTFGEGYHNFHHTFQSDYRNGICWYHFDPTKWIIWTLSKLNLATKLKKVDEEIILLSRLKTKEDQLKDKISLLPEDMSITYKNLKETFFKKIDACKNKNETDREYNRKLLIKSYKEWEKFINQLPTLEYA